MMQSLPAAQTSDILLRLFLCGILPGIGPLDPANLCMSIDGTALLKGGGPAEERRHGTTFCCLHVPIFVE